MMMMMMMMMMTLDSNPRCAPCAVFAAKCLCASRAELHAGGQVANLLQTSKMARTSSK